MDAIFADIQDSKLRTIIKKVIRGIRDLHATKDIKANLVALGLCCLVAFIFHVKWLLPQLTEYHSYIMVGVVVLAALQIYRSSECSMLLPTACLVISLPLLIAQHYSVINLHDFVLLTQCMLGLGVLGVCRMILNMN